MAAALDNQAVTLDELPAEQRALLLALEGRNGPTRARALADAAHITRLSAGQRLEALERHGLVIHVEGAGPTLADHVRLYELTDLGRRLVASSGPEPAPSGGAVAHPTVVRDRTGPSERRVVIEVSRALDRADKHLVSWLTTELDRVYRAGVSDGYVQGVAAEVASRTQKEASRAA
jgi:DNA-binding MarR family transcriptional regulator